MVQRVLHIIGRMDRAGAETMLMNLYRETDRSCIQFDFACFSNDRCDYDDEIETLGGQIVRIQGSNPFIRFWNLWNVLRRGEWQIVHSHTLFSSGLHLSAAMLAGVPKRVAHAHSTSDANSSNYAGRAYQRGTRWLLSWIPTHYVACGKAAAEYLFPGRQDVTIIPNAIDIERFSTASATACKRALGLADDSLTILQVGRLMPVKNHAWSVQIASVLRTAGVKFQMLFVGTGPEISAIEALVLQHGLEEQVRLLGLRADIAELMAVADVMLMPSLHEGFPVVLVESQAAGLPAVISSAISPEVDLDLGLVHFVDLEQPAETWAKQIRSVAGACSVPEEKRKRSLEGSGFSARKSSERLLKIYGI